MHCFIIGFKIIAVISRLRILFPPFFLAWWYLVYLTYLAGKVQIFWEGHKKFEKITHFTVLLLLFLNSISLQKARPFKFFPAYRFCFSKPMKLQRSISTNHKTPDWSKLAERIISRRSKIPLHQRASESLKKLKWPRL